MYAMVFITESLPPVRGLHECGGPIFRRKQSSDIKVYLEKGAKSCIDQ